MAAFAIRAANIVHAHLTPWRERDGCPNGQTAGDLVRKEFPGTSLLLDAGDLIGDTIIADLMQGNRFLRPPPEFFPCSRSAPRGTRASKCAEVAIRDTSRPAAGSPVRPRGSPRG